jgi:hypothetical protein
MLISVVCLVYQHVLCASFLNILTNVLFGSFNSDANGNKISSNHMSCHNIRSSNLFSFMLLLWQNLLN